MGCSHVIWDWNGTLVRDDALGRAIMNGMLARRGLQTLTRDRYREILTFPIADYYRAAGLDLGSESYEALAAEFIGEYDARWRECALEPGMAEILTALDRAGVTQSVLSANRHGRLVEQIDYYGLANRFVLAEGIADDLAYGKDHLAARHLRALGIRAGDAVYVGDTLHDAQTAAAIGCRCVLAAWGHQSEERLASAGVPVCARPSDLAGYLGLGCL